MPSGQIIDPFHVLHFETPAVGVLVEDDRGRFLLEKVYRYTTNTSSWEIPAGGVDPGESPVAAAKREVFEETGYRMRSAKALYAYHPTNGTSDKVFHIVRGRAGRQTGSIDPHEVQALHWASRAELRRMLKRRDIRDGLTLSALLFIGTFI